jgi:ABC-type uncharacterized transport system permease subunit
MTTFEAILLTIVTASTPLLIAALGELVTERSGVLNLGVEGMMAMGAACSFAAAVTFDSTLLGVAAGMLAGTLMAALFALVVLGFAANQVGSGLALTIFGLGLSGLIGAPFVGARRDPVAPLDIPVLSDIPVIGRLFFEQDLFVYASIALTILVALYLTRSRSGLTLRSIGENHTSANALGLPVWRVRLWAILFGGACSGLAGAYLALVYTRFWSHGRARLDRPGARRLRGLAAGLAADWRLYLRGGDRAAAPRPGRPVRSAAPGPVGGAVSCNDHRPAAPVPAPWQGHRSARFLRGAVRA